MSAITPDTDVILLKVPLEITQENQLTFANATAQYNYFHGLTGSLELQDFTYQRKDGVIRCGVLADDLYQYNYVMYRNNGFSNKWFYAFIDKVEYLNHNTSAISIRTDVWQTWQFDLVYKPTFVEREHVNDDTVGIHTVPEGLETGEYINQPPDQPASSGTAPTLNINYLTENLYVVLGVSQTGMDVASPAPNYNGIFSGIQYIAFPTFPDARGYINYVQTQFSSDPIVTAFMCPQDLLHLTGVPWSTYTYGSGITFEYAFVQPVSTPTQIASASITKPTTIDGYSPKNNKVLAYPYQFLDISNNTGNNNVYHYELFKGIAGNASTTCEFTVMGSIGTGCSIQCIPLNYNKTSQTEWNFDFYNYEEALDAPKLPTCGWTNDAYTNWLTQNAVNIGVGFAEDIINIGAGVAAKSPTGVVSGLTGVASSVGQIYAQSKVPLAAKGGVNQGELVYSQKRSFSIYKKCIRNEYARIIDNFFSMFGYKVNEVKVPNVTGRTNWNYVKTIDCYIKADIPQEDLKEIKDMFNNGVTFWHNPSTFADYSQSNTIVS